MSVTINGTTGITLPSGSSAVGTSDSQTLTNKTIGNGYAGSTVTSGTAQSSTSGTSITFTGIPSWVKRITVMFNQVSTSSTSNHILQIGSGSYQATGYVGVNTRSSTYFSTSFILANGPVAAQLYSGTATLTLLGSNTWTYTGLYGSNSSDSGYIGMGTVTLGGTLDRLQITTASGTDTFDAGSINILYE